MPISKWPLRFVSFLQATCDGLKALSADSAESLFCLTEAAKLVKCTITKTAAQEEALKTAAAAKKISSIYFAYTAMKNLKIAGEFI